MNSALKVFRFQLYILNEEDIPHMLLQTLYFPQIPEGFDGQVQLSLQKTVNDESVRNIDPVQRKCYFPDEQYPTKYKYYSYSVCVTECLKRAQLRTCNCTHHNMIFDSELEMGFRSCMTLCSHSRT
jgi:acid-sensing ion channel, other